ncbi:MAG: cation diffusion facilitator family transporter [Christensenellales bacterium]|jgi:cation diffusion facilitator family transporter
MEKLRRRLAQTDVDIHDHDARERAGARAGAAGVALNALLFLSKFAAGRLSGSIAITADAFNNLADAGSSLVTLVGFKLANKRPHADHPFGHGRIEYIAGLIVSIAIIMTGFDLGKTSIERIFYPGAVEFSTLSAGILIASIVIKLCMALYYRHIARRIASVAMRAAQIDSLADAGATTAVLLSMYIARRTGYAVDGYAGALVAAMILWAGIGAARDTISPLLGRPPDPALVAQIRALVFECEVVTGMHDLVVHDYGAGRRMISLHAEVPSDGDFMATHDSIDLLERRIARELHCHAVIHMDPLATDDALVNAASEKILAAIRAELGAGMTIHDFRMVAGPTHNNVIFDAALPPGSDESPERIKQEIERIVGALDGNYHAIVTVDVGYGM